MVRLPQLFINGQWLDSSSNKTIDVINPATEKVIASIPLANEKDVNKAVQSAKKAFITWQQTNSDDRAGFINAIVAKLIEKRDEMAATICAEQGMPITFAHSVQAGGPILGMASYATLTQVMDQVQQIENTLVVKEPIGVCAVITPWNYPLHQLIAKVAPALAAGCTMVIKPSEETPLCALLFAKIIEEIGLPPGVINLITGDGVTTGSALTCHPDVDLVSFTGSTSAGIQVALNAAITVKRVCQELGGKSANIITPEAPLEQAVTDAVTSVMFNCGQTCVAATRVLIHQSQYQQAIAIAKKVAESFIIGDPLDKDTFMGPLCSAKQQQSVLSYIQKGLDEGANLITGGIERPQGLNTGFYVKPTIFSEVTNNMVIAREEIFGPVICFMAFDDLPQAIDIANDTDYGLAAKVWAGSKEQAIIIAKQIRAGQITLNGGDFNFNAPFGGFKRSGNGREWGEAGLDEFIELKSMQC
ncbi:MAG: aldehyde dehydrogenase (NAD+) [Colwellia sp.]|jgi:aldehyde dehydrogenase (NAD+)